MSELEKQAKTIGDIIDWFRDEADNVHLHYCGVTIADKIQKLRSQKWVPLEAAHKLEAEIITREREKWLRETKKLRCELHEERCYTKNEVVKLRKQIAEANKLITRLKTQFEFGSREDQRMLIILIDAVLKA